MKTDLMVVNFDQDCLNLVNFEGQPYVAMKPIVKALSLDWRSQQRKLLENKDKFNYGHIAIVAEDGKKREMGCIPLKKLNGWLFTVNPLKIPNLDIRAKVEKYQEDCFEVLWNHWVNNSEKSSIQKMMDNLHKMKVTMCGFDQMSYDERKQMQSVQLEIQGILGLRPKSQVYKRIKMREPLNLLINGISSGRFRRMIGLQPQHRDVDNRPMKTVDFLPQANQYAICKADLYLVNFLEECEYAVEYSEACQLYLQYGNMAKIEAERKYHVKLHDSVRDIIQSSLDFVQQQLDSDVSPYGQTEQRLEQLKMKLNEELYQSIPSIQEKVA